MNRQIQVNITIVPEGAPKSGVLVSHVILPTETNQELTSKVKALLDRVVGEAGKLRSVGE